MAFTGVGFEGTVSETEFSQILGAVADHGVMGTWNDSSLSAAKVIGSRTMLVQPGFVFFPGVMGHLDAAANATAAAAPSPTLTGSQVRIDLLVARCDWSGAGSVTLVMKAGTQAASTSALPPSVTQTPGVLFEIPLRQGLLTAAVQGEYTTSSMVDRRYWIEAGTFVIGDSIQLPPAKTGAMAYRPDTHQLLRHNGSSWDTYKAESDTGWVVLANPYGGFTGSTWGRLKNGMATVTFPWTKGSAPITSTDITLSLNDPAFVPGFDVTGTLFAGSPKAPILLTMSSGSSVVKMDSVTINAGGAIRGSITYPVG